MKCRINYNDQGNIISVTNPQGKESILFNKLALALGEGKALDVYALTETEDFKTLEQSKAFASKERNKSRVRKLLDTIQPKNDGNIVLMSNNKEYDINIKNIRFKVVDTKNMRTYIAVAEAGADQVTLGKIRLKEFNGSYYADQILLSPIQTKVGDEITDGKGLGIGTEIMKKVILNVINSNRDFYISKGRTEGSAGLVKKLSGVVETRNINGNDVDGIYITPESELSVQEMLTFATKQDGTLSAQDEIDVRDTLIGLGKTSYSDVFRALGGLVTNGVVIFTEKSLNRTGMYNQYEIDSILNDVSKQESIRSLYHALKNSDDKTIDAVNPLYVVTTSKINSLGKQTTLNPYIVEQEVAQAIAGKDLAVYLDDIPYDSVKSKYPQFQQELDDVAANTRNLAVKKIELGEVVDKTKNTNRERFEKVFDTDNSQGLIDTISFLSGVTGAVWNNTYDSSYAILKDFNKKAKETGIDFLDLHDRVLTKSQDEILDLLTAYKDLLIQPTENNMDFFFDGYSSFFDVSEEPMMQNVRTTDDSLIYLESDLSEAVLFNEYGLLKEGDNTYRMLDEIIELDEAYEVLATMPYSEDVDTIRDNVADIVNRNSDMQSSLSDLENMIAHKMYFGAPLVSDAVVDSQARSKYAQFTADYEYMTKVYPSDFYKQYLKEKDKNSEVFKNFYSKFDVTERGIVLKENDPLTVATIQPYITPELAQYNLISRHLNLPFAPAENVEIDEMQYRRENAINNPDSVPRVKGNFNIVSKETIAVKNEGQPFIRTPNGVYEIDYQIGNITFYNILPQANPIYNSYGQHRVKTESSVDVRTLSSMELMPEDFIKAKNHYSKKELEEINERFFSC